MNTILSVGFETTIPVSEKQQEYALVRTATGLDGVIL
jgi:hypothetical protein